MAAENVSTEPLDFSDILDLADDAPSDDATMTLEGETPLPPNRRVKEAKLDLIRLTCRNCQRKLRVKANRAGQRIKCPKCENAIAVPGETTADAETSQSRSRFGVWAKRLAKESPSGRSAEPAPIGSSNKRGLRHRRYRQLTKTLEQKGLLSPESLRTRAEALRALGQSQDQRAFEWLRADLNHHELSVRQAAVMALGELNDRRALPLLVAKLDDPSLVLRKAVILSLGKLKDPRAIKPLLLFGLENPQMKFLASEAIVPMEAEAVQILIELLNDGEPGVVLEAIVLLGRIKDPRARRALTAAMESQQPLLQCHAIEALGQLADSKTIGPLARLLDNPNANVRVTAASALARMASDKNIVPPLVKALKDTDEDVVIQAARGLGESGDKRAAGPLSRLLQSREVRVRSAAALALGHLGDARAIPQLLSMLDLDNEEDLLKALTALRALKDPQVAGNLLKRLDHRSPAVRRRVVDVLGVVGDAEVAERLEHLLRNDPAEEVRMTAARALGDIADPASADALKRSLENDEFNVRCQAVGALGEIGDEECYNILVPLLRDPVPEIRYHAAMALGEAGHKQAIPLLKDLLKDKKAIAIRGAAKALEKLGFSNVEIELKRARRSQRMAALGEFGLSMKSWLPDSAHTQKMILGGSLAAVLLIGLVGWLVTGLFAEPPAKAIVRGNVQSLAFTADGDQIAVGRTLGLVEVWDVPSGNLTEKFTPAAGSNVAGIRPPETLALIAGTGIQIWQKSEETPLPTTGHSKPIARFVTTPDQSFAATVSIDGQAILWDLNAGRQRASLNLPATQTVSLAVSADGKLLGGGNSKGQVTIWNTASSEKLLQLAGPRAVVASSFHPDGKTLAVAYADQIIVWNLETREKIATLDQAQGLTGLQYNPQGTQLAGLRGATVTVWDTSTLTDSKAAPKTISVKADQIDAWAFSRDGSKLAVGGTENSPVWIYDTATGKLLKTLDAKR